MESPYYEMTHDIEEEHRSFQSGYNKGYNDAMMKFPFIRCEDCKYWVGNGADTGELPYWLPCKGVMRRPDYFCADGKRRNAE